MDEGVGVLTQTCAERLSRYGSNISIVDIKKALHTVVDDLSLQLTYSSQSSLQEEDIANALRSDQVLKRVYKKLPRNKSQALCRAILKSKDASVAGVMQVVHDILDTPPDAPPQQAPKKGEGGKSTSPTTSGRNPSSAGLESQANSITIDVSCSSAAALQRIAKAHKNGGLKYEQEIRSSLQHQIELILRGYAEKF